MGLFYLHQSAIKTRMAESALMEGALMEGALMVSLESRRPQLPYALVFFVA
jgi:hypothetical protein